MSSSVVYLGAAMVVVSIVILVWLLSSERPVSAAQTNLQRDIRTSRDLALSTSARDRLLDPIFEAIARFGHNFTGEGTVARVRRKLELAGLQEEGWSVERLLVIRVLAIACSIVLSILALSSGVDSNSLLIVIAAVAVGILGPMAWLNQRAEQRQKQIERQLPDIIDQLTVSVEAGLGFDAAMARSAEGRTGPLAEELRRVLNDIQLGMSRGDALDRMAERTEVADVRQFVVAVRQSAKHGLPIARVLQVQSHELREKRRARIEERAGALPVKIVFPLVFCILPPLFVVILGPAAMDIVDAF